MITKNGSMILGHLMMAADSNGIADADIKNYLNEDCGYACTSNYQSIMKSNLLLAIGTGTTPPTLADYIMEGELTNNITQKTQTSYSFSATGNLILTITATNVTNEDVTVNSIGVYMSAPNIQTGLIVLCARDVLEEPVTLSPNESATFSYEIAFN